MNEEEFMSQVLRNQITLMSSIQVSSDISRIALENRVEETKQLLNPTNNKSAVEKEQERTKEFFEEDSKEKIDCDCHMFIGGSGEKCDDCKKYGCGFCKPDDVNSKEDLE